MQNNEIEIEMQLHEFSLIFHLNRIMTLWQANSDIIITRQYMSKPEFFYITWSIDFGFQRYENQGKANANLL